MVIKCCSFLFFGFFVIILLNSYFVEGGIKRSQPVHDNDNITIYVSSSSTCTSSPCQSIDCPCTSIQSALDFIDSTPCNNSQIIISLLPGVYQGYKGNQQLKTNAQCPLHITFVHQPFHPKINN